ncbi:unnamed protein product [Citrullus colocynthis]|uniref:Uncharacterized protein n=1 Tax=Citrullus colocynthis TaxID=252529 RepID=A0ABP0XLS9_9ROSI
MLFEFVAFVIDDIEKDVECGLGSPLEPFEKTGSMEVPAPNDPDNKALPRDNIVCQKDVKEGAQTFLASDKSGDDVQVVSSDDDSFWGFKNSSDAEDVADLVRIARS